MDDVDNLVSPTLATSANVIAKLIFPFLFGKWVQNAANYFFFLLQVIPEFSHTDIELTGIVSHHRMEHAASMLIGASKQAWARSKPVLGQYETGVGGKNAVFLRCISHVDLHPKKEPSPAVPDGRM